MSEYEIKEYTIVDEEEIPWLDTGQVRFKTNSLTVDSDDMQTLGVTKLESGTIVAKDINDGTPRKYKKVSTTGAYGTVEPDDAVEPYMLYEDAVYEVGPNIETKNEVVDLVVSAIDDARVREELLPGGAPANTIKALLPHIRFI